MHDSLDEDYDYDVYDDYGAESGLQHMLPQSGRSLQADVLALATSSDAYSFRRGQDESRNTTTTSSSSRRNSSKMTTTTTTTMTATRTVGSATNQQHGNNKDSHGM